MDCHCPTTLDYIKELMPLLGPGGLAFALFTYWMGKRQPRPEEHELRAENRELRRASVVPAPAPSGEGAG